MKGTLLQMDGMELTTSEPSKENSLHNASKKVCHSELILKGLESTEVKDKGHAKHEDDGFVQRSIPFYKLFSYADSLDYFLMLVGGLGAAAHGAAVPIFFIFFGKLIDTMGSTSISQSDVSHKVAKYALDFVYLSVAVLVSGWLEVSCWIYTGERQSARIRLHYLKAMLSQDVGFFDTDTSTGEIVVGISSDTILVQEAIGEKIIGSKVDAYYAGYSVYTCF